MPTRTQLDLRARAGQLLTLGFDGVEMTPALRRHLAELQPGGIILFARNIQSPRQTWQLLRDCQSAVRTPLFLCVDMEGGTVDRLRDVVAPAPAVADIAASGSRQLYRQHGRLIGDECRALGFNTDFAPVVDLALAPSLPVMRSRTVSADPEATITYAREFLRGLREAGILGCGKHFPGLGEAALDTHRELPAIPKPWRRLWDEDLVPYRRLHRQMPFVMIAHAAYTAVTRTPLPASLSPKWITSILREKIGYRGLVISDDLEMGGVQAALPVGEAAVATLLAGADIFLVCHKEELVSEAFDAVCRALSRPSFAARVVEASRRILSCKRRSPIFRRRAAACPTPAALARLQRRLWELGEAARLAALARTTGDAR
jgi:beta-N-acetylhexosaminidase